ncbi:MAG: ABC transporter ATP-binding protein [Firmicutes bacterium]|nr:ABC transporter ATP-binding protein [Bacillota bacterium]
MTALVNASQDSVNAVAMNKIVKRFPGVVANDHIDFTVDQGEIHALIGENGAGKSTLMHILAGVLQPDSGEIYIFGERTQFHSAREAIGAGIGIVHQHFMLVPSLTVLDNLILGMEPAGPLGILRRDEAREQIRELCAEYGFSLEVDAIVGALPVAMQQQVEIVKCLLRKARIMIFDEPTSVLTPQESDALFLAMKELASRGRTIIVISHKLDEIMALADRITVLRDGRVTGIVNADETDESRLARMMVGREIHLPSKEVSTVAGEKKVVLSVDKLLLKPRPKEIGGRVIGPMDFQIRAGEILGIAAISGNGQAELVQAIAGLRKIDEGQIQLMGKDLTPLGPRERRELGLAYIPQDRRGRGSAPTLSALHNAMACHYRTAGLSRRGWLRMGEARVLAEEIIDDFGVRVPKLDAPALTLSGGNLQKLVVGRELSTEPLFLIAEDPTQGVDIGSVESIRKQLLNWASRGCAVLLVSGDLSEVLALSDRILVLYEGQVSGERQRDLTSEEEIGLLMTGGMRG